VYLSLLQIRKKRGKEGGERRGEGRKRCVGEGSVLYVITTFLKKEKKGR